MTNIHNVHRIKIENKSKYSLWVCVLDECVRLSEPWDGTFSQYKGIITSGKLNLNLGFFINALKLSEARSVWDGNCLPSPAGACVLCASGLWWPAAARRASSPCCRCRGLPQSRIEWCPGAPPSRVPRGPLDWTAAAKLWTSKRREWDNECWRGETHIQHVRQKSSQWGEELNKRVIKRS